MFKLLLLLLTSITPAEHEVRVIYEGQDSFFYGSGVLVNETHVATNWHVVNDYATGPLYIIFSDWSHIYGDIVAKDKTKDVAIIKIKDTKRTPVILGAPPLKGFIVTIKGFNAGVYTNYMGIVSVPSFPTRPYWFKIENAAGRPGDSGGGVYNTGKLVGLVWGTDGKVCYGVNVNVIKKLLEQCK